MPSRRVILRAYTTSHHESYGLEIQLNTLNTTGAIQHTTFPFGCLYFPLRTDPNSPCPSSPPSVMLSALIATIW